MLKSKPSLLSLALVAAGVSVMFMPHIAMANDDVNPLEQPSAAKQSIEVNKPATTADDANASELVATNAVVSLAASDEPIERIAVKGYSRSLIDSLNSKRFSDTVSEQLSADDLGGIA